MPWKVIGGIFAALVTAAATLVVGYYQGRASVDSERIKAQADIVKAFFTKADPQERLELLEFLDKAGILDIPDPYLDDLKQNPSKIPIISSSQSFLYSDSYFFWRGTDGDPWISIAVDGPLSSGARHDRNQFFIVKQTPGRIIHSGDIVQIRGTAGDPWISVKNATALVGGRAGSALNLVIEKHPSSLNDYRSEIRYGDYVTLKTEPDKFITVPPGGGSLRLSGKPSRFVFVEP